MVNRYNSKPQIPAQEVRFVLARIAVIVIETALICGCSQGFSPTASLQSGQTGNSSSGVVATPTATPASTPTPTPAPTATPKPTATPTPVPTATPKPTATPTPAPTATPTPSPTPVTQGGVTAQSALVFLNSTGVNTHISQGYSGQAYIQPLQYLGVHNIRDSAGNLATTEMVHSQTGVLVDLIAGGDLTGLLSAAQTLSGDGALLSLEGPNEPNNFPITYQGEKGGGSGSWLPIAYFQRDLYSAVKGNSALKQYPVFAVSEGGAETSNVGMQFLTIPTGAGAQMPDGTQYADYANPHNYVSGTQNKYVNNQAWSAADPTLNSMWDGLYVEYGDTWYSPRFKGYSNTQLMNLPRVTTETGWDSVSNAGGEPVQGTVLVNTYLAQFKRGWTYTFIYELVDAQGGSGNQGLFHSDFTPKLAATYIHNLTSILADKATVAHPGQLAYSIANQPTTVHDLLLQKSSGLFELVVWDEEVSGTDKVVIDLGNAFKIVNIYDTTVGTSPTQTFDNVSSVTLSQSNHAMIIEVSN